MIRVLLLCAFSLSACSVASECGGDTVCDSEKDAAVLLQSAVQTREYESISADVQQITGSASTDQGLKADDAQVIQLRNKQEAPTTEALTPEASTTEAPCSTTKVYRKGWWAGDGKDSPSKCQTACNDKGGYKYFTYLQRTGGCKCSKKSQSRTKHVNYDVVSGSVMTNWCSPDSEDSNGERCLGKNQTVCDASGDSCTWSGEACQIGCKTFEWRVGKYGCPTHELGGYCFWTSWTDVPTQRTFTTAQREMYDAQKKVCSPVIWSVDLGGTQSIAPPKNKQLSRPEFQVTEHYDTDEEKWVPCAGGKILKDQEASNCFYGSLTGAIRVHLTEEKYTHAAAEFSIDCAKGGRVEVMRWGIGLVARDGNDRTRVWYNLKLKMDENRIGTSPRLLFKIEDKDNYPVIRVETSRRVSNKPAEALLRIRAFYARAYFDTCMETKNRHGQCLNVLSLAQSNAKSSAVPLLRMDHNKQLACMNGEDESEDCKAFRNCLQPESEKLIKTVIGAFGLVQASQNLTHEGPISCKGGYTAQDHEAKGTCKDPAAIDIEAVDCNCYEWVEGKTSKEIWKTICGDPFVCCYWKVEHGCDGYKKQGLEPGLLLEETQRANTMAMHRHQQEDAQGAISLDDSLSGKRACR